ncbi:MAG: hypothetical protein SGJ11_09565 [Phycisphaerae bacterium]|nr:hypothetical protein [Phycisphaerae bacterium]
MAHPRDSSSVAVRAQAALLAAVLALLSGTAAAVGPSATVLYVDDSASPGGDGLSWANAFGFRAGRAGERGSAGKLRE